jgi:sugar lactone lactonase YvrE
VIEELIRDRLHEAFDVEPTPQYLRAKVISSLPSRTGAARPARPSLEWARTWVAALLALALVAGLVYVGRGLGPQLVHKAPHRPIMPAYLKSPSGLAISPDGSLYLSDLSSSYVFRRLADGSLVTVAGTRPSSPISEGDAGAGGNATNAYLYGPAALAFDRKGNLYVADLFGQRIRRIDAHGVITTYAGSGPAELGMGAFGGDGGPATRARLNLPDGIAIDSSDNLYIADSGNGRIRRVDTSGRISSLDDSSLPVPRSHFRPNQLAFDASGNLYVLSSDYGPDPNGIGCEILRRTPGGLWSVVAGTGVCGFGGDGGPAAAAQIMSHGGLAFDSSGLLYFADTKNGRIRRVDGSGVITTVVGGLQYPQGLAIAAGNFLYFAEQADESLSPSAPPGRVSVFRISDAYLATIVTSTTPIRTSG